MTRLLGAMLVFGTAGACSAGFDYDRYQKLTGNLVKVEAHNRHGGVSVGTGVVVGPGFVATNCHVTQHADSISLVKGGLRMSAESQHADVRRDICLLFAPRAKWIDPVELFTDRLRPGVPVYAAGYILGLAVHVGPGQIRALHDYAGGQVIQSTTPFASGASGGGLFDESGRLVGIVSFRHPGGESYHFSLPAQWVAETLRDYDGKPVRPVSGRPFWSGSAESQPFFLRAASLEADGNWPQLVDVARMWSTAEPGNAFAWLALGRAYYELKQNPPAIEASHAAVAIDPLFAEAWYSLGLAYAANGEKHEAARVRDVLRSLDAGLASELSRHALECRTEVTLTC